jgi:hypothetical protein
MKKKYLEKTLHTNADLYNVHLTTAESNAVEKKWGTGDGEPFSVEPYRMEILGISPGKFLDKPPKKITKNKYCYHIDGLGKIIARTEYSEPYGNQWIVYREFYEQTIDGIVRYSYGSAVDGQKDTPNLQKVALIEFKKNSQVNAVYEIFKKRLEYTETRYEYIDNAISKISTLWPDTGMTRSILVSNKDGQTFLHEVTPDGIDQIYPE